ncbi:uncharacterized protein M2416_003064 [Raoultella sp. BIGb0132]|jgi:uncharacterized protein|nr:uncharacterized protein [Raoultella sp. BIGb0132]MCS4290489.1 uncharacterized protein [Raoultella terrigena]
MTGRCHRRSAAERELKVLDVNIYRHHCQSPQQYYHQLRQQGVAAIRLVPQLQPQDAEAWGAFLCAVFAIWVREDIGRMVIFPFESALRGWCGEAVRPADAPVTPACRDCPWLRICGGDCPPLNAQNSPNPLCAGYRQFYSMSAPYMRVMRDLQSQHRSPAELMPLLR